MVNKLSLLFEIDTAISANDIDLDRMLKIGKASTDLKILKNTPNKDDTFDDMKLKVIDEAKKEFNFDFKNLTVPYVALSLVFMVNSMVLAFWLIFLKELLPDRDIKDIQFMAMGLVAVFCAPITEELYKRVMAKQNTTASGFFIFNIAETLNYMSQGVPFMARIGPIMMHAMNTIIHKYGVMSDRMENSTKNTYAKYSTIIPTLIHMAWNSFAMFMLYLAKESQPRHNFDIGKISHQIKSTLIPEV